MHPLLLAALTGVFLLAASIACALAGSVYVGAVVLAGLPLVGALATFRCAVSPTHVALALTAPTALLSGVLSAANPSWSNALIWSSIAIATFLVVLLSAHFGLWRKSKLLSRGPTRA
jgi:hypothetical protein